MRIFSGFLYCNTGPINTSKCLWKFILVSHTFHDVFRFRFGRRPFHVFWPQNPCNDITDLTRNQSLRFQKHLRSWKANLGLSKRTKSKRVAFPLKAHQVLSGLARLQVGPYFICQPKKHIPIHSQVFSLVRHGQNSIVEVRPPLFCETRISPKSSSPKNSTPSYVSQLCHCCILLVNCP